MTTTEDISLNRLVQSRANVRQTERTLGIESLMASIAAHGLRQNLNVRATTGGRFEVVAGGRRLIALKKLARAGTVAADMPVPCFVLNADDNATEISLAENQLRQEMHPDDQCAAFQSLLDDGMPVEDIAARFGVTPAVVRQRLKLAAVSPKLRALFRRGEATLAQLMALTLSDDHVAQEVAYGDGNHPRAIRAVLTRDTVWAKAQLVRFVGLDAYRAAGGGVIEDLFNPEDGFLTDAGLLQRLAEAKLAETAVAVAAEGWSWVLPAVQSEHDTSYRRVYGTPQPGGGVAYTPEQLAHAGARVGIDYAGNLNIERGLVRSRDARKLAKAEGAEDEATPARADYPASLITDLTGHRTTALRLALAQNPRVALAATVHALATYGTCSALQISCKTRDLTQVVADTADCTAHAAMTAALNRWHERIPADTAVLWDWLMAQDTDTLLDALATFAALSLDSVRSGAYDGSFGHADQLAAVLDLDMAACWQPSPRCMGRLSKAVMAAALTESGNPTLAADIMVMKKPAAAAKAAEALAKAGWLPPVLRQPDAAAANANIVMAPWESDTETDEEAA